MDKIQVTFFQRKKFDAIHFSLEFIFEDVRRRLSDLIEAEIKVMPYLSKGLMNRVKNALFTRANQNTVNHITGDIYYVGILTSAKKTIQTILDCGFLEGKSGLSKFILWLFWLYLPIKRAKKITTISEFVKQNILSHVKCDPDKIVVIPVAVSEIYKPVAKPFNSTYPVLLQIGTTPNKNVIRLAEAIQGIPCKLVIIGKISDELKGALEKFKIDYSNAFNLTLDEVFQKYTECDILTFASTHEGFGMPIVEANCVERPVLTSNVASMPDVAGNAACLVDPYSIESIRNGVLKIINDTTYRENLIANGRENKKRFNPETIAMSYYRLYQAIADQKHA